MQTAALGDRSLEKNFQPDRRRMRILIRTWEIKAKLPAAVVSVEIQRPNVDIPNETELKYPSEVSWPHVKVLRVF